MVGHNSNWICFIWRPLSVVLIGFPCTMPSLGTWLDKTLGVASVRPMLFGFPCTMPLPGLRSAEILDLASFRLWSRSSRTNRCAPLKYLNLYLVFNNRWWSQTNASLTMRGRLFSWFGMNLPRQLQSTSSIFRPTANSKACLTSTLRNTNYDHISRTINRLSTNTSPQASWQPCGSKAGPLE